MSSSNKVALVTGANRGIGYAVVKIFCQNFDGTIILTARNREKGLKAVQKLKEKGLHPQFLQMDVSSMESIIAAKKEVEKKYGRLDILVNNAGVCLNEKDGYKLPDRAEQSVAINFYGVANTTQVFLPLLQPRGRAIIIGSEGANLRSLYAQHLQDQLTSPTLTIEGLSLLMDQYVKAAKSGNKKVLQSWPPASNIDDSYEVAETGKIILNELFAKETDVDFVCVSPGWVDTDMGGPDAPDKLIDGVRLVLTVAQLPPGRSRFNGKFVNKKLQYITWETIKAQIDAYLEQHGIDSYETISNL